jgi:NAD(P) transhydrogenase subunit beta
VSELTSRDLIIQATYFVASILFILGLRSLTKPTQARLGMQQAAFGMLFAVIGTLLNAHILSYQWIMIGLIVGTIIGYPMAMKVAMTSMPQFVAFSHAFGAIAATIVGVVEYRHMHTIDAMGNMPGMSRGVAAAIGFEVLFGALTVTGSFMAFGKLQELITGRPITFRGQNAFNITLIAAAFVSLGVLIYNPDTTWAFYTLVSLGLFLGVSMVLPIGGGDMPVVISLLNSYAGLAASATGFAIGNNVLIIAGALEGAGGFILSLIMSKAMNRSFANIVFGAFGSAPAASTKAGGPTKEAKTITAEDAATQLAYAGSVVIIPGYGMAVAQAQHTVFEITRHLREKGKKVRFGIHPVAGRMPGHMNVLLAEANVPYDEVFELEDINSEFGRAVVAFVIGANDVTNPAAKTDPTSAIYGMPILDVEKAKTVLFIKRGMGSGYAGVENELFFRDNTMMLFGDAKKVVDDIVKAMAH